MLMEARLEALYKDPDEYEILERFKASTLKDKTYKPLFPYYEHVSGSTKFSSSHVFTLTLNETFNS